MVVNNGYHFFYLRGGYVKRFISLLLCLCIISCCFPLVAYANDNTYATSWDDKTGIEKLDTLLEALNKTVGTIFVDRDYSKAYDIMLDFADHVDGNFKVSGDSDDEKAQSILDSLNGKFSVINQNQKQQIRLTGTLIKDYKTFMKQYIADKETPLYYTVHIPSIDQLYPSNVGTVYMYNQIKQAVKEFGLVCVTDVIYTSSPKVTFLDFGSNDSFFLFYNKQISATGAELLGCTVYNVKTESRKNCTFYTIRFDDDHSLVTDIKNNFSSTGISSSFILYPNYIDYFQDTFEDTKAFPTTSFFVADKDMYIKIYTTLANYQNSLAGKVERKVYYTTNYYNNTYNDTDIDY